MSIGTHHIRSPSASPWSSSGSTAMPPCSALSPRTVAPGKPSMPGLPASPPMAFRPPVGDDVACLGHTRYAGHDPAGDLELRPAGPVLLVHEGVRAGRDVSYPVDLTHDLVVMRASHAEDIDGDPSALDILARVQHDLGPSARLRLQLAPAVAEHGAFVGHQAGECESGGVFDRAGQVHRGRTGLHAHAIQPGMDIDHDVEGCAARCRSFRERADRRGGVHRHGDSRALGEGAQPPYLERRGNHVRNEDVAESVPGEHLRLADGGCGDAFDCPAGRELLVGYRRAAVSADVGPQIRGLVLKVRRHRLDVAVELLDVHDEGGSVELDLRGPNGLEDRSFHVSIAPSAFRPPAQRGNPKKADRE